MEETIMASKDVKVNVELENAREWKKVAANAEKALKELQKALEAMEKFEFKFKVGK